MPFLDTDGLPCAHRVVVAMCADENCGKLHILFLDENHKPMAFGAIDSVEEHIESVKSWAYVAATRKPD